jgi:ABC-type polysaccharide/polyol phosphate transport system ATPase subunit
MTAPGAWSAPIAPENAIEVRGMSKRLRLRRPSQTLKGWIVDRFRARAPDAAPRAFDALRDVTFNVRRGETLGIIGANGAGKTTLLSLIAGTMRPTGGEIMTQGVISSLLELGAGFHPDLSGRENIFLAGAILGMKQAQIAARYDAIVEFAGLRPFIDQPVKHYSSGMYVRLGFSVAVEVDPDILLVDEVLAVGDLDFQRKCLHRMREFHTRGRTMLIVSHDMETIKSLSDRILLLDRGRVVHLGQPAEMVSSYRLRTMEREASGLGREWGTGEARITGVELMHADGSSGETFAWGETLRARLSYRAEHRIDRPVFGFALADRDGRIVYGSNTQIEGLDLPWIEGEGALELALGPMQMARGAYLLSFSLHSADHRVNYHRLDHQFRFLLECPRDFEGVAYMPARWTVESRERRA